MGLSGPIAKSAEVRVLEGGRAHRPLPAPGSYSPGTPDRPKGMTARARQVWDGYIEQLGPMGVLRIVDGFALRRLCEDVALLEELQKGMRRLASEKKREAKSRQSVLAEQAKLLADLAKKEDRAMTPAETETARVTLVEADAIRRELAGGALVDIAMSPEGRRLAATINALASRIKRDEQQFGLTPVASQRLENLTMMPLPATGAGAMDPMEAALCG